MNVAVNLYGIGFIQSVQPLNQFFLFGREFPDPFLGVFVVAAVADFIAEARFAVVIDFVVQEAEQNGACLLDGEFAVNQSGLMFLHIGCKFVHTIP